MLRRILLSLSICLCTAATACEGGADGVDQPDADVGQPDAVIGTGTVCPDSPVSGAACELTEDTQCFQRHLGDCATSEICHCFDGVFVCEAVDWGASCSGLQNGVCAIEGRHGCVGYPTSGQRVCEIGAWLSFYSCSPGCPIEEDGGRPQTGDNCAVAEGGACDYIDELCDCIDGRFVCTKT